MTDWQIRIDGKVFDFQPTSIHPFNALELFAAKAGEPLQMRIQTASHFRDGVEVNAPAQFTASTTFLERATIFALVPGGWLPLPHATPPHFIVDRNVVIKLAKIRRGGVNADPAQLQWWTQFFQSSGAIFNPLPYAWESGTQRKPTFAEFVEAFKTGVDELAHAFPSFEIVRYSHRQFLAAYGQLEAFDDKFRRECEFLLRVCPLLVDRIGSGMGVAVESKVFEVADSLGIRRGAPPVLAALSCIYEDPHGEKPSIGRMLLKPSAGYSQAQAYNALSDFRNMELAVAGQVLVSENFHLATCDIGMAAFWSALAFIGQDKGAGKVHIDYALGSDLLPRLNLAQIQELTDRMKSMLDK